MAWAAGAAMLQPEWRLDSTSHGLGVLAMLADKLKVAAVPRTRMAPVV